MWNKSTVWFKVGFVLTAVLMVGMNAWSYVIEARTYESRPIHFSHSGFRWGFPFGIYEGTCYPCFPVENVLMPLAMNLVAGFACAAVGGAIFEAVSGLSRRLK